MRLTATVLLSALTAIGLGARQQAAADPLVATNILGTDGTVSMLNVGTPEVPIVIDNIAGLALTDPSEPGDNLVFGGRNAVPDLNILDTYFQGTASAKSAGPSSVERALLLLDAQNGGSVKHAVPGTGRECRRRCGKALWRHMSFRSVCGARIGSSPRPFLPSLRDLP